MRHSYQYKENIRQKPYVPTINPDNRMNDYNNYNNNPKMITLLTCFIHRTDICSHSQDNICLKASWPVALIERYIACWNGMSDKLMMMTMNGVG